MSIPTRDELEAHYCGVADLGIADCRNLANILIRYTDSAWASISNTPNNNIRREEWMCADHFNEAFFSDLTRAERQETYTILDVRFNPPTEQEADAAIVDWAIASIPKE